MKNLPVSIDVNSEDELLVNIKDVVALSNGLMTIETDLPLKLNMSKVV